MKVITLFILLICTAFNADLIREPLSIEGKWINGTHREKIEIYRKNDKYFGKIIWREDSLNSDNKPLKDENNPNENLKNKPLIGLEVFKDLRSAGQNIWRGGKAYDPKSGRFYNCQISLKDSNAIDIRKFFGLTLIGSTERWTRIK